MLISTSAYLASCLFQRPPYWGPRLKEFLGTSAEISLSRGSAETLFPTQTQNLSALVRAPLPSLAYGSVRQQKLLLGAPLPEMNLLVSAAST